MKSQLKILLTVIPLFLGSFVMANENAAQSEKQTDKCFEATKEQFDQVDKCLIEKIKANGKDPKILEQEVIEDKATHELLLKLESQCLVAAGLPDVNKDQDQCISEKGYPQQSQ